MAINHDERYPDYALVNAPESENAVDIPDELVDRYNRALQEYNAVQDALESLLYPGLISLAEFDANQKSAQ